MSDLSDGKQPKRFGMRVKLALVSLMTLFISTSAVMAADLNASVGPILDQLVQLFVPILAMILGMIPIVVTIAILSFILGILSVILKKIEI